MTPEVYCNSGGYVYIIAEATEAGRNIRSMELLISIAKEKIASDRARLGLALLTSEEIEGRQEEINDIELAIDDLTVYATRLRNIPKSSP